MSLAVLLLLPAPPPSPHLAVLLLCPDRVRQYYENCLFDRRCFTDMMGKSWSTKKREVGHGKNFFVRGFKAGSFKLTYDD